MGKKVKRFKAVTDPEFFRFDVRDYPVNYGLVLTRMLKEHTNSSKQFQDRAKEIFDFVHALSPSNTLEIPYLLDMLPISFKGTSDEVNIGLVLIDHTGQIYPLVFYPGESKKETHGDRTIALRETARELHKNSKEIFGIANDSLSWNDTKSELLKKGIFCAAYDNKNGLKVSGE